MPPTSAAYTEQAVRVFTRQLRRSGVEHVVIAPGSRSTPLTLAFARDEQFRCWLHLDERSAGYFALGLARQLRAPVGLVCTSGTAAANFMPAVIEAYLSRVPLVVLTADRPPELYDVGANQTIDQARLYGTHVKWTASTPIADGSEPLLRHTATTAARAVASELTGVNGPRRRTATETPGARNSNSTPEERRTSRQRAGSPGRCRSRPLLRGGRQPAEA